MVAISWLLRTRVETQLEPRLTDNGYVRFAVVHEDMAARTYRPNGVLRGRCSDGKLVFGFGTSQAEVVRRE